MNNLLYAYLPYLNTDQTVTIGVVKFSPLIDKEFFKGVAVYLPQDDLEKENTFLEALYILYFCLDMQKIYEDKPLLASKAFLEIDFHPKFLKQAVENIKPLVFFKKKDLPAAILQAFNQILKKIRLTQDKECLELIQALKYFISPYFSFKKTFSKENDILFLTTSFEVLFKLNPMHLGAELRQNLRTSLHLKYSSSVELLWKWVEEFYKFKNLSVKGDKTVAYYKSHANLELPYLYMANKIFIYCFCDKLYKLHLLQGIEGTSSTPDDFKLIHATEILPFFWTEETLLKKIAMLLVQLDYKPLEQNHLKDLNLLIKVWHNLKAKSFIIKEKKAPFDQYFSYKATPKKALQELLTTIFSYSQNKPQILPAAFIKSLNSL